MSDYLATIKLKTNHIYNIDARLQEIDEITDWLENLVSWQPNKYEMQYRSSFDKLDIWFKEEKHAMACILRWS